MSIFEQFSTDPAANTKAPPLGAPNGGTSIKSLDDICRTLMAAIREVGDLASNVQNATESVRGIVELATIAEVQAGTDTVRAVTPAGLAARTATLTRAGVVELATSEETLAGADTARAVTPAGLAGAIEDIVLGQVPAATTSVSGVVELATSAEAQTGTDTARAVTPAALAAVTATATRAGLVELATNAEAIAGSDTTRAVTPAGLAAAMPSSPADASTTTRGIVELATNAEVATGTDTVRAVTPAGLASLEATAALAGLVELATAAEVATGTDATRAVTPKGIADNISIGNPGYINLPGTLVIRYGFTTTSTGGARTITFGTAFANAVNCLLLTPSAASSNYACRVSAISTSAFTAQLFDAADGPAPSGVTFYWLAIGG